MARVKLVFSGIKDTGTDDNELVCYKTICNEIMIQIKGSNGEFSHIYLDKSTSIKLHRELKKQISFIEDEEVSNG